MIIRTLCSVSSHQASQRCSNAWGFLYIYVHSQITLMERLPHFTKHYMAEADLVALLESRGLVISEEVKAVRHLENIGYYRLSAYMYPFLKVPKESHQYKDATI